MRCANCSAENPPNAKFCIECATPFQRRCPNCGSDNPPQAKFCAQCATQLDATRPVERESASSNLTGERRHLTVLFCDVVGSTEIAARLDPEEWREVVASYQRAVAEAVGRFGGHVAKYLGDGVMAFFGYPEAHDNDAERAARAGLAIVDSIPKLNQRPGHAGLSVRVGIDSGTVVVGSGAGKDADVFGDAPNVAARVQAAAGPGTVLATAATEQLIAGLFVIEEQGGFALKGIAQPVKVYRVIQPRGVRGRLEATAAAHGLTPFVGREDELRSLMSRWERMLEGEGQVVMIVGEAGIGKSRLVHRFHEQIATTPHTWLEAAAAPFYQNTPFYPVSAVLHQMVWEKDLDRLDAYLRELQIKESNQQEAVKPASSHSARSLRADSPPGMVDNENGDGIGWTAREQLAQLQSDLALAELKPAEAVPLIAPLLNLPIPAQYLPSLLSPEQQRRRLLATLVEWILIAAQKRPLVIAIEDMHWADPSTLELTRLLIDQGATARLLLLYTARPEFRPQWPLRAHHTQLTLNRLSTRNVRTMVAQVAAQKALTDETVAAVVERTGGVPLFVEELTRALLENGSTRMSGREIPVTLHDSLMARLDRLGPAKEVIQVGAVIGSEFSYDLLHAVFPLEEEKLQNSLRSLTDAELLYVRGIWPDASYRFKHALIQDAAYEALLKSRRKELHRLVAQAMTEKFPALKEAQPEVVARHWTEAGEIEVGVAAWAQAAKAAESRNAFDEAVRDYEQALTLLEQASESGERIAHEVELSQNVISLLYVTKGWAAPETIAASERAAALAEKSANPVTLCNSVGLRGFTALISGALDVASALADQAMELGRRENQPYALAHAHLLQVMVHFWRGDLEDGERLFVQGQSFFEDAGFKQSAFGAQSAYAFASYNALVMGRTELARRRMSQMAAVAAADNPHEAAFSSFHNAMLHFLLREYDLAEQAAGRTLEISEKHQFPNLAAMARSILGPVRTAQGSAKEGAELIRQAIAGMLQAGQRLSISYCTATLAIAQAADGAVAEALETIEKALEANPGELAHRPEVLRIRGELRLKAGQPELAERDFRNSISLAQSMMAKAWELRSSTSLARLQAAQGHGTEARTRLAAIIGWFSEGFETPDLIDARALLDQLPD